MSKFSTALKDYRVIYNLTQTELGQILGMSQSQIGNYELGKHKPTVDTLKKIAIKLNLDINELID
jgi:transcriptional regulator with XRE-family HTH domain